MNHEELEELLKLIQRKLQQREMPMAPEDQQELSLRLARADANPLEGDDWTSVRARLVGKQRRVKRLPLDAPFSSASRSAKRHRGGS